MSGFLEIFHDGLLVLVVLGESFSRGLGEYSVVSLAGAVLSFRLCNQFINHILLVVEL